MPQSIKVQLACNGRYVPSASVVSNAELEFHKKSDRSVFIKLEGEPWLRAVADSCVITFFQISISGLSAPQATNSFYQSHCKFAACKVSNSSRRINIKNVLRTKYRYYYLHYSHSNEVDFCLGHTEIDFLTVLLL